MTQAAKDVLQAALALPVEDRVELIDELVAADNTDYGELPFHPSWLTEIERRSAEYDAGLVQAIPWNEVKRRAREKRGLPGE